MLKFKRPILVDQNGCWNWIGSISSQGYAIFNHKLMYGIVYNMSGRVCPPNYVLRHKCNNKKCINGEHIHEGTYSDNMIDAVRDGMRGLGKAKYAKMVELELSGMRRTDIARELNISKSMVSFFFKGKTMVFKPEDFGGQTDA